MNHLCLLADDHPAVVAFVRRVIEEHGLEIVGPAATGPEALTLARERKPSLALSDLRMPGVTDFDLIADLLAELPRLRIAVYTAEADAELAQGALSAGARAVVLKDAPVDDLTRVLAALQAGSSYLDPALAGETLGNEVPEGGRSSPSASSPSSSCSPPEKGTRRSAPNSRSGPRRCERTSARHRVGSRRRRAPRWSQRRSGSA